MKPKLDFLNHCRVRVGPYATVNSDKGMGKFEWKQGCFAYLIISSGDDTERVIGGWEHVSVSKLQGKIPRIPTWEDMSYVKSLFWSDDETVLQFHPKRQEYVNKYPWCLHLWKKIGVEHELPPTILV